MIGVLKFEDDLRTTTLVPCIAGDMSAADAGETLRYVATDPLGRWVSNIERRARQILLEAGHDPSRPGRLNRKRTAPCFMIVTSYCVISAFSDLRSSAIHPLP
jgi:hypothetical protein